MRWTLMIAAMLVVHSLAHVAFNQWRGRAIVAKAGLPQLPSRAWITYAHIDGHDLLFEEVALGFTAPSAQMDEWMKGVDDWDAGRSESGGSILSHSIRRWDVTSGVDFSATISYK